VTAPAPATDSVAVLVVEDDPVICETHRRLVDRVPGFRAVATAHSGAAAVAALREVPVDLVLLDVVLPDTSGIELCRRFRSSGTPVDVVAVTSARDVQVVQQMLSLGVVQYLVKPFPFATFRETLERYAAYRRALSEQAVRETTQHDVDRLLSSLRPTGRAVVPKGLSPETWADVCALLRELDEPVSASEVADRLGVSRVTARRYLEALADGGSATRSLRHRGPGRPELLYCWGAPG
jgi:response regulator of citrate/malate metabolism